MCVPQMKILGDELKEGDVILSNHPCAGGSHLPDLTVITPVSILWLAKYFKTKILKGLFLHESLVV